MRVLVLGGSGFIGSHLVDQLIKEKHEVVIFSKTKKNINIHAEYIFGDFDEIKKYSEIIFKNVDLVLHLIWNNVPSTSQRKTKNRKNLYPNLENSITLIDEMVKHKLRRIIYFSTGGAIYGNLNNSSANETSQTNPISLYGIEKLMFEKYLLMYQSQNIIDPIILRPSNPYGPRQRYDGVQGVISRFIYLGLKGQPIIIRGDGSNIRDFIYISDMVGIVSKICSNFSPGIYNISSNKGYSISNIIELISNALNIHFKRKYIDVYSTDVNEIILDNALAKEKFQWNPQIELLEGIKSTGQWIRSQINHR